MGVSYAAFEHWALASLGSSVRGGLAVGHRRRGEFEMANEKVSTAVVAAAGSASRMWPASKVVPKELFPLGRLPAIAHLALEFLEAGIRRMVIVGTDHSSALLKAVFDPSVEPPANARKFEEVQRFQAALSELEFEFVMQSGPYGNGTPLRSALEVLGGQPCIYAFGDDVVIGENITTGLIKTFEQTSCPVLAVQPVERSRVHALGIVECTEEGGVSYVSRLVEKPRSEETTSNLAAFGRYFVTKELAELSLSTTTGKDGELWFVDSVIRHMDAGNRVCACPMQTGKWYTVGDPAGYLQAVQASMQAS